MRHSWRYVRKQLRRLRLAGTWGRLRCKPPFSRTSPFRICHGRRKDLFPRGPKVANLFFSYSKLRKQRFFAENFKTQGLAPLPTPMVFVTFYETGVTLRHFKYFQPFVTTNDLRLWHVFEKTSWWERNCKNEEFLPKLVHVVALHVSFGPGGIVWVPIGRLISWFLLCFALPTSIALWLQSGRYSLNGIKVKFRFRVLWYLNSTWALTLIAQNVCSNYQANFQPNSYKLLQARMQFSAKFVQACKHFVGGP